LYTYFNVSTNILNHLIIILTVGYYLILHLKLILTVSATSSYQLCTYKYIKGHDIQGI